MPIYSLILIISLIYSRAQSGETDNFKALVFQNEVNKLSAASTGKLRQLKISNSMMDSTATVDTVINGYIRLLTSNAKNCNDRDEVMTLIRYIFDTNFPDVVQDVFEASDRVNQFLMAKTVFDKANTIYKGFNHPEYSGGSSPVLKLNGHNVGLDKVDHFLSHGFMYYRRYSEKTQGPMDEGGKTTMVLRTEAKEKRIDDALEVGLFQEESSWGLTGTGIKSYGDLGANYSGLKVYIDLLESEKYLKCENNRFVITNKFEIKEYVDDSWDESINCSSYNSEENKQIVLKNMRSFGFEKCPIDEKKCEILAEKYKEVAGKMLHPLCRDPKSDHPQVEAGRSKFKSFFQRAEFIDARDLQRGLKGAQ